MTTIQNSYITSTGTFLPGEPVGNDQMEEVLGLVHGKPSRLRQRILKSNGIQTRYYALDRKQKSTHQNSELAAAAARACLDASSLDVADIDMLAVGSTQGDLPLPGMASMVQAALDIPPCEIISTHGVCSSGVMALKSAHNQIRLGEKSAALVCASELSSRLLKKTRYEAANGGALDFEAEFLRWMLSDGAGAFLLQPKPKSRGLSLRIDWIELISWSSDFDLCMSCGTPDQITCKDSWQDYDTYADAEKNGALLIRQNLRILDNIVRVGVEGFLRLIKQGKISPAEIDHFVCHYSSHHFRGKILELFELSGCMIPEEKWFTNLYEKGNTGCASIFIALDELFKSGRLRAGDTVFCSVPESGRFTTAYIRLTAVEGE